MGLALIPDGESGLTGQDPRARPADGGAALPSPRLLGGYAGGKTNGSRGWEARAGPPWTPRPGGIQGRGEAGSHLAEPMQISVRVSKGAADPREPTGSGWADSAMGSRSLAGCWSPYNSRVHRAIHSFL